MGNPTNELKPCPFCGSEAKLFTARGKCNQIVRCVACNVSQGYRQTKKEAIEAWNIRFERTCHIAMTTSGWWECDNCGTSIYWDSVDENDPPACNYCPSCGARVVWQ